VPLEEAGRRRTSWTFPTRACLHHIGDVTIISRKKRRNNGPNATTSLVTNLPDMTAHQVVDVYRRRWAMELLIKELKGATGLGQHSGHQRNVTGRALGRDCREVIFAAPEVPRTRHSGRGPLKRLYAETELHLATRLSTDRAFYCATHAETPTGAKSRMIKSQYLS
jgi:hypothetical protein